MNIKNLATAIVVLAGVLLSSGSAAHAATSAPRGTKRKQPPAEAPAHKEARAYNAVEHVLAIDAAAKAFAQWIQQLNAQSLPTDIIRRDGTVIYRGIEKEIVAFMEFNRDEASQTQGRNMRAYVDNIYLTQIEGLTPTFSASPIGGSLMVSLQGGVAVASSRAHRAEGACTDDLKLQDLYRRGKVTAADADLMDRCTAKKGLWGADAIPDLFEAEADETFSLVRKA